MEALRNTTGFFGPNLLADLTLVVQILFYLVLCTGVVAQLQGKFKWHDRLQIPVVVINLFFVFFVMVPTFSAVVGTLPSGFSKVPTTVSLIHGLLGTVAQLLAIYCLLAGIKILPRKIGVLRYWMWAAFSAWTATVIFGIGVYIFFYTSVFVVPRADEGIATEHDADLGGEAVQDAPTEAHEPVEEHAEVVEPDESAQEPTLEPAEAPTEGAPQEEIISEHDGEGAIVPEVTEEPEAATDTDIIVDEDTFPMDEMIDEHMADAVEVVEPDFTGEVALAQWVSVQATNDGPGARYEHAIQYSPATNQVFVFGGRDGSQIFNDVWVLDMKTFAWKQLAINSTTKPPARFSTVMTVDDAGENLYVATGHTQGGGNFSDIWRLNLATETWEELTATAGPGPEARYGGPGGSLGSNLILTHGFGSTRYDDTWRFNTASGQWENITPSGAVPLRRCLFAATPSNANLVIHGGCASGYGDCFLDDTWILDSTANAWREVLSDVKPVGRQYQTLTADAANPDRVVLFGGQDASRAARNDLWSLDLTTGNWQMVDAPDGASARFQHAAVWIPDWGMLVYGGRDDSGALGDLWLLNIQPAPVPEPTAIPKPEPTSTPEPPPPEPTATSTPELVSEHDGG